MLLPEGSFTSTYQTQILRLANPSSPPGVSVSRASLVANRELRGTVWKEEVGACGKESLGGLFGLPAGI